LEIIRFSGYTDEEKLSITKNFLIPKQMKDHGLQKEELQIEDNAIKNVIASYTRESGVRNLNREIANLCRKVAKQLALEKIKKM
jgi:ATP-dependent Lon protease